MFKNFIDLLVKDNDYEELETEEIENQIELSWYINWEVIKIMNKSDREDRIKLLEEKDHYIQQSKKKVIEALLVKEHFNNNK